MAKKKIIVWAPGAMGQAAIRELLRIPELELVGVLAYSVFWCMRLQIAHFVENKIAGSIVNCASIAGIIGRPYMASYVASKHAAVGLTRAAALDTAAMGIRVNAVCPGPTATAFGGAIPSEEAKAVRAQKIPLGRMCEPEDIADPILFLAGPAARMITGVALTVDGGVLVKNDTPYDEYFRRR